MQIIRTIIWVVLVIALLVFAINNWEPVTVKIWEGLILETKVPALVLVSFLVGLVPVWLLYQSTRWRLKRRINVLETAVRNAAGVLPPPPAPAPIPAEAVTEPTAAGIQTEAITASAPPRIDEEK